VTGAEPPVAALVEQLESADFNQRALALAALVRRGREAAPAFHRALESKEPEVRVQALRGLAEIADPGSADTFAGFLDANDERLRAFAARGLARIGDARARDALVRTINDFPDELHYLFTPAVVELIALGPPALTLVAPQLSAPDGTTRARAFLVVQRVVEANPNLGTWEMLANSLGTYDPNAPVAEREAAAERWRKWIGTVGQAADRVR